MYEIEFYSTEAGDEPVKEFLDGLNPKMRAKAIRELFILQDKGSELREPHSKYMGKGYLNFELNLLVTYREYFTFLL